MTSEAQRATRPGLTRERVIEAAAAVADRTGIAGVSMRSVGRELGVEAMSLYHHVASKEALLDALVEWLMGQISAPAPGVDWREGLTTRARSQRSVMGGHAWGLGLVESRRSPGETLMRNYEAVLACLRGSGFPVALAAHAFSVVDAYVYGFVLTEQHLPFEPEQGADAMVEELALPPATYPRLVELLDELVVGKRYDFGDEFDWGLELVLDGLAARLAGAGDARGSR